MRHEDFISLRDHTTEDLREYISLALQMKADPARYFSSLAGKCLAMIFEKPSLRTRVTFDVGIHQLGGFSVYLGPAEISLGKRESIADVARNLERMAQGIMVRTFGHAIAEELALHAGVPVINGLTDFSHPCQALGDYMTLLELKHGLQGLKLAYVGDGNNVAHSLIFGAALLGVHIAVATPAGYEPRAEVVGWAREKGPATGAIVELTHDAHEAARDADAVYTDVWASMGRESEAEERRRLFRPYQVNEDLIACARPDAVFLHCLPAHRGEEVTAGVIDSPRSAVFQQAENRLHIQKALMWTLMA